MVEVSNFKLFILITQQNENNRKNYKHQLITNRGRNEKQNLVHGANCQLKSRLSTINPTKARQSSKIEQNKNKGVVELGKKNEILDKKD